VNLAIDEAWDAPANAAALRTSISLFRCPAYPGPDPRQAPGLSTYVGLAGIDPDAAFLPKIDPRAGVLGFDRVVRPRDVSAGTRYTSLATETTRDNGPWLAAGRPTLRGLDPDETHYLGPGRDFGGCHPHGANALRLDGSVEFLSNRVSPELFRAMATLAGREDDER
jgi:prepilin-type processing-associated H-X9-DG protein